MLRQNSTRYLIGLLLLAFLAFGVIKLSVRQLTVGPLASYGMMGHCGTGDELTLLVSANRLNLYVIDEIGRTVKSWTSPTALRTFVSERNCTWHVGLTLDPGNLVTFTEAGATLHALPCNNLFRESYSGSSAASAPEIIDASMLGTGPKLFLTYHSGVSCIYDSETKTSSRVLKDESPYNIAKLSNNSLAVVPYHGEGAFVLNDTGQQQRIWAGKEIDSMCLLDGGRFVVGIPKDSGLMAARVEGNKVIEQKVLFPIVDIARFVCGDRSNAIWVFDLQDRIYAAYISGKSLVEVAGGTSLSGGMQGPADGWQAYSSANQIWVQPNARSSLRRLSEQLWHGEIVNGQVSWKKAASSLWGNDPIRTVFFDRSDVSAVIVRNATEDVFEIRFDKGEFASTSLTNRLLRKTADIKNLNPNQAWISQNELWIPSVRRQHPAVAFIFSYWDRPIPRFTVIFLTLFALAALILPESRIRQYSPIAVIAAAPLLSSPVVANALSWEKAARPLDLALSLTLIATALLCVSFASPVMFRLLCNFAPFSWITPLLLSNRVIRRSVFSQLAADHIRRIQVVRSLEFGTQSIGELYFELGVKVDGADRTIAAVIARMSTESGQTFTIAAEAGAGKSALIREILLRLLENFRHDGRCLPILLEKIEGNGDFLQTVRHAMGYCAIPANHVEAMIVRGDILLVLDGVSEGLAPSAELAGYLSANDTQHLNIVAAMRPNLGWDAQLAKIRSRIAVHLQPGTIDKIDLLHAYCDCISASSVDDDTLQFVARAAMGTDGLYSPLFAKLALLADIGEDAREQATHGGAVIGLAADKLFGGAAGPALRAVARKLAADSYWKFGSRRVRSQVAAAIGRESVALVELGILRKSAGMNYIFWHDLMQTYLAAEQVADIWTNDPAALVRAVTDPIFRRHRAMGYADRDNVLVTEMFQACVWTCRDPRGPSALIRSMLVDWIARWPERFSVLDIAQSFEAHAGERIIQQVRGMQLQAAFQVVIGCIGENEEASLVTLFCSLALKLPVPQAVE